jgi:hypothetical protein
LAVVLERPSLEMHQKVKEVQRNAKREERQKSHDAKGIVDKHSTQCLMA